ncbi:hypothetical protein [Halorientalis pallida]|uniref:Uncharacterized protein n=1 Tax=Halorientalis pallida TaxID=2479928 RepID=A0A498KZ92_9EURY|nr:hypothetical protein [Halorientalis pallida]RXK46240.1 hypothetical protein EAF64_20185 [Halorientalis pallida]
MEAYEEAYVEAIIENLGARMATCMREDAETEMVRDRARLTDGGRLWACGYVTSRLSMLRADAADTPNLSAADHHRIRDLVDRHESTIASELHS